MLFFKENREHSQTIAESNGARAPAIASLEASVAETKGKKGALRSPQASRNVKANTQNSSCSSGDKAMMAQGSSTAKASKMMSRRQNIRLLMVRTLIHDPARVSKSLMDENPSIATLIVITTKGQALRVDDRTNPLAPSISQPQYRAQDSLKKDFLMLAARSFSS